MSHVSCYSDVLAFPTVCSWLVVTFFIYHTVLCLFLVTLTRYTHHTVQGSCSVLFVYRLMADWFLSRSPPLPTLPHRPDLTTFTLRLPRCHTGIHFPTDGRDGPCLVTYPTLLPCLALPRLVRLGSPFYIVVGSRCFPCRFF